MKKIALMIILVLCTRAAHVLAWGVWAHNHINKGAVLALPEEMGMFFYNHCDFITEESTAPDIRKHIFDDKAEGARHFIDLERFGYTGRATMPKTMEEAIAKYGKDTLNRYGVLPWCIQDMMEKLTDAFKHKRKAEILFLAANLGHYIADAHMPLHTSINHNGQLTGQEGVHAFWESQLPELFGKNYDLFTGSAHYIDDIEKATWDIIDTSHAKVFRLLEADQHNREGTPIEKQYEMESEGKPLKNQYGQPVHAYEYARIYHELLAGMVEKQMKSALKHTADFWYTAWVNAGKPDLNGLDPDDLGERNKPLYRKDMKAWEGGQVQGCGSEKEFPSKRKL